MADTRVQGCLVRLRDPSVRTIFEVSVGIGVDEDALIDILEGTK